MISVPPFKVTGHIHLMPERNLREALTELSGDFLPVTDATYWSDVLGEARQTAALVAINHERAQILAPHTFVDPWADARLAGAGAEGSAPEQPTGPGEKPPWPAADVPPPPTPPAEPTGW